MNSDIFYGMLLGTALTAFLFVIIMSIKIII